MKARRQLFLPVLATGAAGVALAACGGGSPVSSSSSPSTAPAATRTGTGGSYNGPPAISGQLAAINGNTLEIQDPTTGQTTVDLTTSTVFTQTVSVASSALQTGQCVLASGTKAGNSVSASNVTIDLLNTGPDCAGGFGAGPGGGFGGFGPGAGDRAGATAGTTRTTLSTARRQQLVARIGVSAGKVTSINGTMVDVQLVAASTASTAGSANPTDRLRVTPLPRFTFSSSTRFGELKSAAQSELAVGQCVTAVGQADTTGTVTAQRISIRPAGPNGCRNGFGRRFGAGGAPPGAGA